MMNIIKRITDKLCRKPLLVKPAVMPRFTRPIGWKPKAYILQKDLPNVKKGAIFLQTYQSDNVYFYGIPISGQIPEKDQVGIIEFEAKDVENSKWFVSQNEA